MNLLTAAWIPLQYQGNYQKISLQQFLCGEQTGELCLPRDDMELACLQLLCAITQVLLLPSDKKALLKYLKEPISADIYEDACSDKMDWFDLNHEKTPFMQFRDVTPSKTEPYTNMDKLLAGVSDGANKTFVNPQDLGAGLCESCTSIALFNMANNAPSVGGGFQGSFRGNTPITVLIKGSNLRETVWLNILSEEAVEKIMPWHEDTKNQKPNYVDKDIAGKSIDASRIGLARGLLWQPAHYELYPPIENTICSCCQGNRAISPA
jgi:CRISPR system Cascade subunit CasA